MQTKNMKLHTIRKAFKNRFYNKLMFYNIVIFIIVTLIMTLIATNYALKLQEIKQLQIDRDALNSLYNYYERKNDEFLNLIFPLYEDVNNFKSISRLLEAETDIELENDPYAKKDISSTLEELTLRDSDIETILIYKTKDGSKYQYVKKDRTLEYVEKGNSVFEKLRMQSPGRHLYGSFSLDKNVKPNYLYGIAGTLGTSSIHRDAGRFMITYKTSALEKVLQVYSGKLEGRFLLLTLDGEVIFDSGSQYGNGNFQYMDQIKEGTEKTLIDGVPCFVQTVKKSNSRFIAAHIVPVRDINSKREDFPAYIIIIFTLMAVISAILYVTSGAIVSRRIGELKKAMKRVGSNNLSYRIPLKGKNDEFEEIAERFNQMCEELQITINREYITEIKKKNAELNALQAGINPHFLFNTLETIRVKAFGDGNYDVGEMLVMLANLLRSVVRDKTFIPVQKEIDMCDMYMQILALRYTGEYQYDISIEPQILDYGIPKNLLQPIIENYFKYGMRENYDNKFVLRGWEEGEDIYFSFEDNGKGMNNKRLFEVNQKLEAKKTDSESSYGLVNVNERIHLVYGEKYGLSLESTENCGTRITMCIKALTCEELLKVIDGFS